MEWIQQQLDGLLPKKAGSSSPLPKAFASIAVLTSSFFALQNLSQRFAGKIGLYAGRAMPITTGLGFAVTAINICASNCALSQFQDVWDREIDHIPTHKVSNTLSSKDLVRRTVLGLTAYTIIEGGLYRTVFPSSSIALGAYANTRSTLRSSIVSNSPVANEGQRRRIQEMGKRFGCHQCGNRQLFTKKVFIADHMPPTKRAEELSARWWRKLLKLKVSQRLWPQCQKCYSVQGAAVRAWTHLPIYHSMLRMHHFAPLIALGLEQNKEVREACDKFLEPIVRIVDGITTRRW